MDAAHVKNPDELADIPIKPLEKAVPDGRNVKDATSDAQPGTQLPPADELGKEIVTALGAELARFAKAEPGLLAQVSKEDLQAWVTEDVTSALAEIAATGWTEDVR